MTIPPGADHSSARLSRNLGARSGTTLGSYELVRRIGSGGMAEVYEAVHRGLKKTVAIKVLLPDVAGNADLRARFLREGEAASRIEHPHVVDVTDVGEDGGVPYLVMELLSGETLTAVIDRNGRLSVPRTLDILLPIAAALSEAHRQGVVHRDIKPDNVFVARTTVGRAVPKLLDFGVSKMSTSGIPSNTAVASLVLGTPHYMAPEQALGSDVDARADQYALALVVYECITGQLPFRSENVVALLHEVARGVQTPPSVHLPELPASLDTILLRALSANPSHRYADLGELVECLLPFASPRAASAYRALTSHDPDDWRLAEDRAPSEVTGDFTLPSSARRRLVDEGATTEFPPPLRSTLPPPPRTPSGNALGAISMSTEGMVPLPSERRRSRALPMAALGLAFAAGLGITAWVFLRPNPPESDRTGPSAPHAATEVEASSVQAAPAIEGHGGGSSTVEVSAVAAPPSVAAPTRIVVVAQPAHATFELDDVSVGRGVLDHSLILDGQPHTLEVLAAGYETQRITFTTDVPPSRVELRRSPGSASTTGGVNSLPRRPSEPRGDSDLRDSR